MSHFWRSKKGSKWVICEYRLTKRSKYRPYRKNSKNGKKRLLHYISKTLYYCLTKNTKRAFLRKKPYLVFWAFEGFGSYRVLTKYSPNLMIFISIQKLIGWKIENQDFVFLAKIVKFVFVQKIDQTTKNHQNMEIVNDLRWFGVLASYLWLSTVHCKVS